jgi:hypothetical protein
VVPAAANNVQIESTNGTISLNISRHKLDITINMDSPENQRFCDITSRSLENDRIDNLPVQERDTVHHVEKVRRAVQGGKQGPGRVNMGKTL